MYMRIAIVLHKDDIPRVLETYELLSNGKYSHASPTMWNAGTIEHYFASCYLYQAECESLDDTVRTLQDLSSMWEADGGLGINVATVVASKCVMSSRFSSGRISNHLSSSDPIHAPGIMPLMKLYNGLAQYASLSSHHRGSSATIYLPIWHCEIRAFVTCRATRASPRFRVQNVFPALMIPDLL